MRYIKKYFCYKVPGIITYYNYPMLFRMLLKTIISDFDHSEKIAYFEKIISDYCKVKYALCLPSGSIALYYIFKSLGLKEEDEIIMHPYTHSNVIKIILSLGLSPVFVDLKQNTYNIDYENIKKFITKRSKVLLLTHLFGITSCVEAIKREANNQNLIVIEDFSQNLGCSYGDNHVGTFGTAGFLSLASLKTCSTICGGVFITNDQDLYQKVKNLSRKDEIKPQSTQYIVPIIKFLVYLFLTNKYIYSGFTFYLMKSLNKFNPKLHDRLLGGNIKTILGEENFVYFKTLPKKLFAYYTDMQAEEGLELMKKVDSINNRRIDNVDYFIDNIPAVNKKYLPIDGDNSRNVYWRFPIKSPDRMKLKTFLFNNNIETTCDNLVSWNEVIKGDRCGDYFPEARSIKNEVLMLPIHYDLLKPQILYIANKINEYYSNNKW